MDAAPQNITDSHQRVGWASQPNGRGTIDIIWSCIFTLFLCVWTVLCLNVPASGTSFWIFTRRKIKWMVVAAIGPEWVTGLAGGQWSIAHRSAKRLRALGYEWTITHSFFADMGGLRLKLKDDEFPISSNHLLALLENKVINFPDITKAMIDDRSKSDNIAKLLTILQTTWFVVQCIARGVQRLGLTPLELSTVAFIVCTLATNILWWSKPKDIFIPIIISEDLSLEDLIGRELAYSWKFSPLEKYDSLRPSLTADVLPLLPWMKASKPSNDHQEEQKTRFRNDRLPPEQRDWWLTGFLTIASVSFGVVYVSGWKIDFPTTAELLIWRVGIAGVLSTTVSFWAVDFGMELYYAALHKPMQPITAYRIALCAVIAVVYITCRLYIITEVFVSLRSLPAAAYASINWTDLFPHI